MMSRKQQKEFEERETKKQEVELTVIIFVFIYINCMINFKQLNIIYLETIDSQ